MTTFPGKYFPAVPGLVVDVGTGHGHIARALADEGWSVVALDRDPGLVEEATMGSAVAPCVGDVVRLPLRSGTTDAIVAMEIMEHLGDPTTLVREIRRVLKPGGRAVVTVPTAYTDRVYRRLHPDYWASTTHQQLFSRARLRRVLTENGLSVHRIQPVGIDSALTWLVHATLRTPLDFTGTLHGHLELDEQMRNTFARVRTNPVGRATLGALGRVAGKSYYAFCMRDA